VRSRSFNSNGLNGWDLERIYEYELSAELTGKKRKFDASDRRRVCSTTVPAKRPMTLPPLVNFPDRCARPSVIARIPELYVTIRDRRSLIIQVFFPVPSHMQSAILFGCKPVFGAVNVTSCRPNGPFAKYYHEQFAHSFRHSSLTKKFIISIGCY